jgi:hypothetical protein
MATTTDDVRDAFDSLSTVNFDSSVYDDGIQVTLNESEAGLFFKTIRVNGFEAESKRLGDSLVARIEAEESGGLGDLFR